jgi:hypothetical protein
MKTRFRALVTAFAVSASIFGCVSLITQTHAAPKPRCGICPRICYEVTCDDGRTYCNSCIAACSGAHNCQ